MVLLLSEGEADCLVPQHKQTRCLIPSPTPDRSPLPRERFSPSTQSGSSHCQKADSQTKLAAEVTLERPSIVLRSCCHESRPSRCRRRPAREAQGQGCTPGSG